MKICIYGAGAIGGYLAVELARSGAAEVTCIARGAQLEAIRQNGLTLLIDGETRVARVSATDDPAAAGEQDFVILALKAPAAAKVAGHMAPLLGADTSVVTAQNGVPWWYFYRHGGALDGTRLSSVDPGNLQWNVIGPARALGCVVYPAAELVAPGVVRHDHGNRFALGEPDGTKSERVQTLAQALSSAGFRVPVRPRIRDEIWIKLWGNCSLNPVSALTGATIAAMLDDPGVCAIVRTLMLEAEAVGKALGVRFAIDVERRIEGAREVGEHRTSMLQDLERGRPLEIDALVTAVQELGRLTGTPTPTLDMVLALVQQRAQSAGCRAP